VDVRVVAATNRSIDAMVRDGTFRQDLFYRLNVVRIEMPSLRERREDIPILVRHFLDRLNERFGRQVRGVEPDAMRALTEYRFPGNVRELENILERAYTLGAGDRISRADLPAFGEPPSPPPPLTEAWSLEALERDLIQRVLRQLNGDRTRAASALGMSERTLYRRLRQYGIS
jgi:DNA-binding NtrC family response regulator